MMISSTKQVEYWLVQVKIGRVQDTFWTVQVEYWTGQNNDATKLCAIFGQYMLIFQQIKLN